MKVLPRKTYKTLNYMTFSTGKIEKRNFLDSNNSANFKHQ